MSTTTSTLGRHFAVVTPASKRSGDCITDAQMQEISERLIVMVDPALLSDVVRSEGEPQDKSKLWYKPSTKLLYSYNVELQRWEETQVDNNVRVSGRIGNFIKKDDTGAIYCIISSSDEQLLELDEQGNILMRKYAKVERFDVTLSSDGAGLAEHTITLTKFEDPEAAINVMPRALLPANARWYVSAQDETTATVKFSGLAASTTYAVSIIAQQTEVE